MASPLFIPNRVARSILLSRYGLIGRSQTSSDLPRQQRLSAVLDSLGYVQLDSIRVVERAHHHILHSRWQGYRPKDINKLYGPNGEAFEHWTHDASLIPISFYPHWHHKFRVAKKRIENAPHWQKRLGDRSILKTMRKHLAEQGATRSREHRSREGTRGTWWDWAPHKSALEYLWWTGEVAVVARDGFQKVYDLTENVIPGALLKERPSLEQTTNWSCDAALHRMGFANQGELVEFWQLVDRTRVGDWIQKERASGRLIDVEIEDAAGKTWPGVARPELEGEISTAPKAGTALKALSPFDPLVRNRKRLERVFSFDYRIEVFVPAHKREFGYYVFPLLEGNRFVGRAELKTDKETGTVLAENIWWEPGIRLSKARETKVSNLLGKLERLVSR